MFKYVIEIPQEKEELSIREQRLRVAAYCRVSTKHEEQQGSLENQIQFYFIRITFKATPTGDLSLSISIAHPDCGQTSAMAASNY